MPAPRSVRSSWPRCRRIHLGLLQVYRLRPVTPPPAGQLKLLFPAGAPRSSEESAELLAQAARDKKPVLLTVASLKALFSSDAAAFLRFSAAGAHTPQLEEASLRHEPQTAQAEEAPLRHERTPSPQRGTSSALTAGGAALDALLAQHSSPLAAVLSSGAAQCDWRKTVAPLHAASEPSSKQRRLLHAVADGDVAALRRAIDECTRLEVVQAALPPSGGSALHLAAAAGNEEALELLLKAGCSVHAVAVNGSTPLHWAAGGGHAEVIRALLRAGADTRARSSTWRSTVRGDNSGQTAAHWAAASGHTSVLELLLEADPQTLILEDERQLSLAQVAANNGHGWLDKAMQRLKEEAVVCVRVECEMTLQSPLTMKSAPQDDQAD
ncbi:hypothetical protein AB1Y20_004312 [Prymnesium parvum]|uniref:Uncharacterized protein n=1 Tax=Prymnesium parvum TaxID=97485 RepID=A0AB34IVZ1_PRYPA